MRNAQAKTEGQRPRVYGYLRVSTDSPDTEKNRLAILEHANRNGLGKVQFVEETVSGTISWKNRELKGLVGALREKDWLLVPELSRLGRSLVEVLEVLKVASERGAQVYSLKEAFVLNGDGLQAKIMRTMLGLFAEIERDLLSLRIKEALKAKAAGGFRLGRPKGPGKSKLDRFEEEIVALLRNGATKRYVARRYHCTPANLWNWMKRHSLEKVHAEYGDQPKPKQARRRHT